MKTNLTLRLRKSTIDRAKNDAFNHKTSLSRLIESYLDLITSTEDKQKEITPLVESLSGVINLDSDLDYKIRQ